MIEAAVEDAEESSRPTCKSFRGRGVEQFLAFRGYACAISVRGTSYITQEVALSFALRGHQGTRAKSGGAGRGQSGP